jgi:prophage tail gpP-like protein
MMIFAKMAKIFDPVNMQITEITGTRPRERLRKRYRRLVARGTHAHVVTVAMARELTGCMWAMAKEVPVIASDQDGS